MIIKEIRDEDFASYKEPAMVIGFPSCSFKCCKEGGISIAVCQNCTLIEAPNIDVGAKRIVSRYLRNKLTSAVVCGGMEPFDNWEDLQEFVTELRAHTDDTLVIYTGYYPEEIAEQVMWLSQYKNVVIKFGRFVPNAAERYDDVLGVTLASENQYAVKIS